jgi:hypothetical protein
VETRGRPPKHQIINADRLELMRAAYTNNPFTSTRHFANQFDCSMETVRKALHGAGIHHRIPAKKISLSANHKTARVRFATDYQHFDFSRVIFTDEKTFKSSQHGRRHLWRVDNSRYEPENVLSNTESGRVTVNMWAWMSADGPGELVFLPERANGETYLQVLRDVMLPSVRILYPAAEMPEIKLVHDNCPIHTCGIVTDWINRQPGLTALPWPSRSPDLNPIEHLWAIMVQRWDMRAERTKEALVQHVNEVWESLRATNICEVLVRSMNERCNAVINAHGAMTKY